MSKIIFSVSKTFIAKFGMAAWAGLAWEENVAMHEERSGQCTSGLLLHYSGGEPLAERPIGATSCAEGRVDLHGLDNCPLSTCWLAARDSIPPLRRLRG